MATKGDTEGFVPSPLDGQGARHKDSYYPMSEENAVELRNTDAEIRRLIWFTPFTYDDERYRLTCAALTGEVASDIRVVLLQPFLTHKYENLKAILIERRSLTTPERVNKVISGEKLGSDIPSKFLRRLHKTLEQKR